MEKLQHIGYWESPVTPHFPSPRDWIDDAWDPRIRETVGEYLSNGTVVCGYLGYSTCRICGEKVGNLEYTDGRFVWPSGLAHYIVKHSVRLPQSIEQWIVDRSEYLEETLERDTDLWLELTRVASR